MKTGISGEKRLVDLLVSRFKIFQLVLLVCLCCGSGYAHCAEGIANEKIASETDGSHGGQWYAEEVDRNSRNDPAYAISVAAKALLYFQHHPNPLQEARVRSEQAYSLYIMGRPKEAMAHAIDAEKFASVNHIDSQVMRAKVIQGHVLQGISEYEQALARYQAALNYVKSKGDNQTIANISNSIANVYYALQRYSLAITYYQKLPQYVDSIDSQANSHLGIGNCYLALNKIDLANKNFELARSFFEQNNDQLGRELALFGLADTYQASDQLSRAEKYYILALNSAKKGNRSLRQANGIIGLTEVAIKRKQWEPALSLLVEAEELKQTDRGIELLIWLKRQQIFELQGKFKESLKSQQNAYKVRESSLSSEMTAQISVMHAMMELDAANSKIELLSKENQLSELELDKSKNTITIIILLFTISILVLFFWWYRRLHKNEREKEQLKAKQLEEMDKFKDRVLANTSHELRTPLNGIIGLTEIMIDNEKDNLSVDGRQNLELIKVSGERLLQLVEDLIQVSQFKETQIKLNISEVDIASVCRDVICLLEPLANNKKLKLQAEIEPGIPKVLFDEKRLNQVLTNLVRNAIKYSDRGVIRVRLANMGSKVLCRVKDEGVGIEHEQLTKIFKPFERVNQKNSPYAEGAGLGLSIVKDILSMHGIEISVKSAPGEGAEFFFEIPAVEHRTVQI